MIMQSAVRMCGAALVGRNQLRPTLLINISTFRQAKLNLGIKKDVADKR